MEFGNGFDSGRAGEISVPQSEVYRYLGYGRQIPDEAVRQEVREICRILRQDAEPKAFYRSFPVKKLGQGVLLIGEKTVKSSGLYKNMTGCEKAVLLAATLGVQVDRRLMLFGKTNVARQVILQAAAAACLEAYLDLVQDEIRERAAAQGWYIRPRFSPGYGDLSLEYQRWIAAELDISRRLGIVLSDSLMMSPSKSVTALIGVSRQDIRCLHNGCESCENTGCAYRRE